MEHVMTEVPFHLAHALEVIEGTYGDTCYSKPKTLLKFGRFDSLG